MLETYTLHSTTSPEGDKLTYTQELSGLAKTPEVAIWIHRLVYGVTDPLAYPMLAYQVGEVYWDGGPKGNPLELWVLGGMLLMN